MEKLVEKIAYLLSNHRWVSNEVGIVQADRDYAREAITRIGKAYADGELELPGEVGRFSWPEEHEEWYDGKAEDFICDMFYEKVADTLIALRPLSGTGKEEEK